MTRPMLHDVFISFSSKDSEKALEVVNTLQSRYGIRCWICTREIAGGTNYKDEIMKALLASQVVVFIQSEASLASPEVSSEIGQAFKNRKIIIPFILDHSEAVGHMAYNLTDTHRVDATKPEFPERIDELAVSIQRNLTHSSTATVYSDNVAASNDINLLSHSAILRSRIPQPHSIFLGRDDSLQDLHDKLLHNRIVFVQGIAGIGKSELVKQYAVQYASEYDNIIYTVYPGSIKLLFCTPDGIDIAGTSRYQNETDDQYFERKLRTFNLYTTAQTLLIIDNFDVDQDSDLERLLNGPGKILLTTRNTHPHQTSLILTELTQWDTLKTLFERNYESEIDECEEAALKELLHEVNNHTYTIELLAKQMQASFLQPSEMLQILRDKRLSTDVPEVFSSRGDQQNAFMHICTLFNVSGLTTEERKIMRYLSLTGIQGVPAIRFKEWAELSNFDIVNNLIKKSWISREKGNGLLVHPLIREVVRYMLQPTIDNCSLYLNHMADFCYAAWRQPIPAKHAVGDHVLSVLNYLSVLDGKHYRILESLCCFLWQIGRFDESISHCHRLYEDTLKTYGINSMEAGFVAIRLAGCYYNSDRVEESIPWYKQALDSMIRSNSGENEDIAMAYEKVARCFTWPMNQNLPEAERLFNLSLDMRLRQFAAVQHGTSIPAMLERGSLDAQLATIRLSEVYMEMGRMYQVAQDYRKASLYAQKQIDLLEDADPDNIASIAYGYHDVGRCKYHLGQSLNAKNREEYLHDAEVALETARKYVSQRLGDTAIDTIECEEHLADVYAAQAKYLEAKAGYAKALRIAEKLFGKAHPRVSYLQQKIVAINA